jgi:ribosomal protein L21E
MARKKKDLSEEVPTEDQIQKEETNVAVENNDTELISEAVELMSEAVELIQEAMDNDEDESVSVDAVEFIVADIVEPKEEGTVTIDPFLRSTYAGLTGKVIQDLGSSVKIETAKGQVIVPKSRVK